ncbi:beta-ureidopropionase [Klebsiella pneumoniae subsp. ozaenae]|uniref:Beta-ureidopropionase n=1 Tax=Klebsiella pneumoniae subsp. ozaenae TaxID=574 RepID=A0A377Z7Z0_KLEPO|nr:beta-ureidopropionase [Klebsiella pneumoniae subsp. ozaenae]
MSSDVLFTPATDTTGWRINGDRLWASLMDLAQIGATPKGGCRRLTLTDLDRQGAGQGNRLGAGGRDERHHR